VRSQVIRPLGIAAAGLALIAGVSGCAESEATPALSTVAIEPSSYETRPIVTTTSTVPPTVAEGRSPVEQNYVVESGDYPILISERYGVTLDEFLAYNDWDEPEQFPSAGTTIKIPPGGRILEGTEVVDTTEGPGDPGTDTTLRPPEGEDPPTTPPEANGNCEEGTYEVKAGDYPIGVAEKFDVSLDDLNAANAGTEGYEAFYPTLVIIIPEC